MNFNQHSELDGKHAFLGASKYAWLNYDEDHLVEMYDRYFAKEIGTRLHAFAAECISLKQKLPQSKKSLNAYVNDAIKYRMKPEQVLYYSINCFGTADAISFKRGLLRIHDLKTGVTPAHMQQLMIYSAIFCLEYKVDPYKIDIELRIYQSDEVMVYRPESQEIEGIMQKIVDFDKILNQIKMSED